jgi:hypothetical protein
VRQLDDLLSGAVRQGAAVHVHPTQLVDPAVACGRASKYRTSAYVMFLLCGGRTRQEQNTQNTALQTVRGCLAPCVLQVPLLHLLTMYTCKK